MKRMKDFSEVPSSRPAFYDAALIFRASKGVITYFKLGSTFNLALLLQKRLACTYVKQSSTYLNHLPQHELTSFGPALELGILKNMFATVQISLLFANTDHINPAIRKFITM